mgnify:CR=1 FL=1
MRRDDFMKRGKRGISKTKLFKILSKKGLSIERVTIGDKRVWKLSNGKVYDSLAQISEAYIK